MPLDCPCRLCNIRSAECHSHCQEYERYFNLKEERRKKISKAKEYLATYHSKTRRRN